jgi:hypothetical protein
MGVVWQECEREERRRLAASQPARWVPWITYPVALIVSLAIWWGIVSAGAFIWWTYSR